MYAVTFEVLPLAEINQLAHNTGALMSPVRVANGRQHTRAERDIAFYLCLTEHAKNLELLEKNQQGKTVPHVNLFTYLMLDGRQGFELGPKLGIEIGETRVLVRTQATITRTLLKRKQKVPVIGPF